MADRELLEMAAKAAGIVVLRSRLDDLMNRDLLIENSARNLHQKSGPWNPLTDDGDALRLAFVMKFEVDFGAPTAVRHRSGIKVLDNDYKRAITRTAAEVGRNMS
mgnify:CR=1 FL=1